MDKIDELKRIIDADKITAEDKFLIKTLSAELGLDFTPRARCKDCYKDQAALLYKHIKEQTPSAFNGRTWRMRGDVDVIFMGKRVNDALLTDELAEEMLRIGLPKHWFYESKQEDPVH